MISPVLSSYLYLYTSQSNSDWPFISQSRVPKADWLVLENNEEPYYVDFVAWDRLSVCFGSQAIDTVHVGTRLRPQVFGGMSFKNSALVQCSLLILIFKPLVSPQTKSWAMIRSVLIHVHVCSNAKMLQVEVSCPPSRLVRAHTP